MSAHPQGSDAFDIRPELDRRFEYGDLLVNYLSRLGVEYVFGIPGGAIEPLYNALARAQHRAAIPRSVVSRHEAGAAFMAYGYARNAGKLGVCCATTGPGATNLITGVASAYDNNVPLLVITAQTALPRFGRGALQESSDTAVDTVAMLAPCTQYNSLVSHVDQLEHKLIAAISSALHTQSPSHLSIPLDILRSPAPMPQAINLDKLLHKPELIDKPAIAEFCRLLNQANRITLMVGDGCDASIASVLKMALLLDAAIVVTPHGKGLVSPYHPSFRGVFGYAGHKTATEAVLSSDLLVIIGAVVSERIRNIQDLQKNPQANIVYINEHRQYCVRLPTANLYIHGNLKASLAEVVEALQTQNKVHTLHDDLSEVRTTANIVYDKQGRPQRFFGLNEEDKALADTVCIKPQRLMTELPRLFPPSVVYLADPGNSLCWSMHYLHPYDRRILGDRDSHAGMFQGCLEFSSMGWAVGAAIGVALARPKNPVVCLVGDGSWLMSGQEITVAKQLGLNITFIILNDAQLGMVKHGQRLAKAEPIGYELPEIDYALYAESIGVTGIKIDTLNELLNLNIDAIVQAAAPTLLDIHIDNEEVPPMAGRMQALGTVGS